MGHPMFTVGLRELPAEEPTAVGAPRRLAREHEGPVCWPLAPVRGDMNGDGYFSNVAALIEACARAGANLPEFVWPCASFGLRVDAEDVIRAAVEADEHHEEAEEQIAAGGVEALQRALDAWVAEYAEDVRTWTPDHRAALVFDEADRDRLRARRARIVENAAALLALDTTSGEG